MTDVEAAVEQLADAGLLTRRQAQAYVLREIEAVPRDGAAQWMGVAKGTMDDYRRDAEEKVESAEATLDVIDDLRFAEIPEACSRCGSALGGTWTTTDDGAALCLECGGVDRDDV
jgi:hypothetical protein